MERESDFRDLILNTREPIVIRNVEPKWSCFTKCSTLRDWCKIFDDESKKPAQFERMSMKCGISPQWERYRHIVNLSAQAFLKEHSVEQDFWTGLQYKRTQEFPTRCVQGIDFSMFGFPEAAEDATLWLSAKGANTPCHYDTYGCNIVCQVYGRKSWLLLPPDAPLTTCRVPYEESSVYCKENLYGPQPVDIDLLCQRLSNFAYHYILEPGDVLIVPRHWWHFVEAVENSLSVNTWLPLTIDAEAQLEECIVKYIMESSFRENVLKQLLNPNQFGLISDEEQLLQLIQHLQAKVTPKTKTKREDLEHCHPYQNMPQFNVDALLSRIPNVEKPTRLTDSQLKEFLTQNSQRFDSHYVQNDQSRLDLIREELLNSICEPKIIAKIRAEFCKRQEV